jgi:hypothetical protein
LGSTWLNLMRECATSPWFPMWSSSPTHKCLTSMARPSFKVWKELKPP